MKRRHVGHLTFAAASLSMLLLTSACGGSSTATGNSSAGSATTSGSASAAPVSSSASAGTPVAGSSSSAGSATGAAGGGSAAALPAASLNVLIGSSGKAETDAVTAAAAAWGKSSGSSATVLAAQDLNQQLAQGFASNKAPDVFYVGAGDLPKYASAGNLLAYGDSMPNAADFYPSLKSAFTYDGKFYCAPKDFSTLALFINTDMWTKAGLTDADIPKDWNGLEAAAKKLTAGKVAGLALSPERDRVDSFFVQNGGYLVDSAGKATVNDPKNVEALTFVKKLYTEGVLKFPKDLGAGWAGEAFDKGEAAMTIEGNWLLGSIKSDAPNLKYKVVQLPAGPTGTKGTLSFTNCWGISATTKNPDQAKALVAYLTSTTQQLSFANAFGVIPSVQSASAAYLAANPANAPFVNGVAYAKGQVTGLNVSESLDDFNTQLQGLATADPKAILDSVQDNLSTALAGG